uniref:Uncharacterized protein n=1 Tax=Brassica campestris TaxID=3711 RepID=A0A3P5Y5E8_BRACM|nr:unnamed protein product [Brassica rapa]VDC60463.1 unnamed protein product [Brassica rapa]
MELTLLSKTELTVEVGVKGSVVSKKYASAIAKASLMSKCVVVDIKEPDSEASAAFRARDDFSDTEIGVAQKRKQFMMRKMNQGLLSTPISKIFNSCT